MAMRRRAIAVAMLSVQRQCGIEQHCEQHWPGTDDTHDSQIKSCLFIYYILALLLLAIHLACILEHASTA